MMVDDSGELFYDFPPRAEDRITELEYAMEVLEERAAEEEGLGDPDFDNHVKLKQEHAELMGHVASVIKGHDDEHSWNDNYKIGNLSEAAQSDPTRASTTTIFRRKLPRKRGNCLAN